MNPLEITKSFGDDPYIFILFHILLGLNVNKKLNATIDSFDDLSLCLIHAIMKL